MKDWAKRNQATLLAKTTLGMKPHRPRGGAGEWKSARLTFFFLPFLTRNSSTEAGLGMSRGAL